MPCAWGSHDGKQLFLNVSILNAADADLAKKSHHVPNVRMFRALIDTGAMSTCITKNTAAAVGLSPIGKALIQGVSGPQYHNNYLFYVGFTITPPQSVPPPSGTPVTVVLQMIDKPIQGAEFDSGTGGFDVLLGMDVISTGSLKIEGNGGFSWCW